MLTFARVYQLLLFLARRVEVSVSSGAFGWSLEVGHCFSCPPTSITPRWPSGGKRMRIEENAAALHSAMEVSSPPVVERGVSLTVLNQRDASVIFQKVGVVCRVMGIVK